MRRAPPWWLAAPTRWAGLGRNACRAVLGLAALLVLLAALPAPAPPPLSSGADAARRAKEQADVMLYDGIADALRHGGRYYPVAAGAMRAGDYPLRPFVTMRLPTLARAQGLAPRPVATALLWLLAAGVMLAWWRRLGGAFARVPPRLVAAALLAGGLMAFVQPALVSFHEVWAGLGIALALALRRPGRWAEAAAVALMAALVRETAALFILVMAAAAALEGRRREAAGWLAGLAVLALALALHARAVAQVVSAADPASPGWAGFNGLGFWARSEAASTALALLPGALGAALVALALAGWASWRDPAGARVAATVAAYALLIALFGRVDTFYWALMVAPLLPVGLAFVPDAARDLVAGARDARRLVIRRRVR